MSGPAKVAPATVADLLAIPEGRRRHEVIDGVLVEKEAASGRHGGAQVRLARRLGPYDRRPGGRWPGGWWFATEVEIQFEEAQVFRPDVAGWRRERLPDLPKEVPVTVRPDFICEILSTNKRVDLIKKKRVYHRHEVGHYWIVDPDQETLAVYRWHADGYVEVLIANATSASGPSPSTRLSFAWACCSATTTTSRRRWEHLLAGLPRKCLDSPCTLPHASFCGASRSDWVWAAPRQLACTRVLSDFRLRFAGLS